MESKMLNCKIVKVKCAFIPNLIHSNPTDGFTADMLNPLVYIVVLMTFVYTLIYAETE